ncbi:MAG TPA: acetate kinase, partial [Methylotenera sp.]|nr:acetate kinase [Methylotenera sp.]
MNILTLNCGSSSLKACLFLSDGSRIGQHYQFDQNASEWSLPVALEKLWGGYSSYQIDAIGHRFVHGGDCEDPARLIDAVELTRLQDIAYLAPLHMPANICAVQFCQQRFAAPQFACFDTAFHHSLPESSSRLPIDKDYGLRRYGFHGINYAHIARKLPDLLGDIALKNVLVAHLGSGASICMLQNLQSVATSMGYTPAGGIPMATRSGDLDPGVMLALAKQMSLEQLTQVTFHQMGLLALSDGESGDMQALLNSDSEQAAFAVSY